MRPESARSAGDPHVSGHSCAPARPRVVVVDDDPAIRASLIFSLELEGFEVEAFSSGGAAVDARIGTNCCLVLDYRLPDMDGLSVLALLRDRGTDAPAIVITSNPGRKLRQAIAASGATLIEKPLLSDTLTASIRAMTEAAAANPAAACELAPSGVRP